MSPSKTIYQNFFIFGASGHLAENYIFPALQNLHASGHHFKIYGYGRTSENQLQLPKNIHYFSGSYDRSGLAILANKLVGPTIFYFALPSNLQLLKILLSAMAYNGLLQPETRLIFEKPFGNNFQTAKELFSLISLYAKENQIFLVDHYLTKDLVKNIISLRFANPIFQQNWNQEGIAKIEIKVLEKSGIENRGQYYDQVGAIKDMVQNHCLQLLSLLTISEPKNLNQSSLYQEKLKVLKNLKLKKLKIGQYRGYLKEPHINLQSQTETFAELILSLNTSMWEKVPLVITTGKKLSEKRTEIIITFNKPQLCLWGDQCTHLSPNQLIINLHPENQISLSINTEFNPTQNLPKPHHLKLGITDMSTQNHTAYENVLHDVLDGNHLNMPTFEEILLQWKFIDSLEKIKSIIPLSQY